MENLRVKQKLFELSDLVNWFREEDYRIEEIGPGCLRVVPDDPFTQKATGTYHVYPGSVFKEMEK